MIPLYKLEKLPRAQQLRKISKYFGMAENRIRSFEARLSGEKKATKIYSASELVFFYDAVKLLIKDAKFSDNARKKFADAMAVFDQTLRSSFAVDALSSGSALPDGSGDFRRALNSVKHILLMETGGSQADWDFDANDYSLPDGKKLDPTKRQIFNGMRVYLEDIRSPFNVGAIFRTCESFGVEKIILSPFCADPNHRRAQRTAMGCIDIVPWERQELFSPAESVLTASSAPSGSSAPACPVFALETGGIPINEFQFPKNGLLIAGSEELGVSPPALAAADASLGRVSIPCYGAKASLNVSVAFGIALQAWAKTLASGR